MRRTLLISALSMAITGLLLATSAAADPKGKGDEKIKVQLKGLEEAPVAITGASGQLQLTINEAAGTIAYELTYEDLEGTVTQSHIHVGQKNIVGGIAIWLCQTATNPAPTAVATATPQCPQAGKVTGTITAASVIGPLPQLVTAGQLDEVIDAIRAGVAYGNVHSVAVPGGEIRGQLK